MNQVVFEQTLFHIMNAGMRPYPFPHFLANAGFSNEFLAELLANLPPLESYIGIKEAGLVTDDGKPGETRYLFRFFEDMDKLPDAIRPFWEQVKTLMLSERFANALIRKFSAHITERFQQKGRQESISMRMDLLRDFSGYSLGPHTDTGRRLLNLFIYLPQDDAHPELGTSIYVPVEPGFTCEGGPHYPHEKFINVFTAPYTPGSIIGFFRTNQSFHGVEPVGLEGFERNALALSLYAD